MTDVDDVEWLRRDLAGEYEVERSLGGSDCLMQVLARDSTLSRPVVVVSLTPAADTAERRSAWRREVGLLARVQHPGVRAVYRAMEASHGPVLVLEHVTGETLEGRLAAGRLGAAEATQLARDLIGALDASHAKGVARPGLEPASIVCRSAGAVLAGLRVAAADDAGRAADLYAAAAIVYRAAAGDRWDPSGVGDRAMWAPVPRRLRPVLRRALAERPEDRWPDAAAFRRALGRIGPARAVTLRRAAILSGLIGMLLVYRMWKSPGPVPGGPPKTLAILPFEVVGGPPTDSLGVVLAHLLQLALGDVPSLDLTSQRRIVRWLDRHDRDAGGRQAQAARELNARWVAHGLISRTGSVVRVRLTLYDSSDAKTPLPEVGGTVEDLARPAEELSRRLLRTVAPDFEPRVGALQDFSGISFGALKAFLKGEAAFDRDAWTLAQQNYETAIGADSMFALARWRLANVKRWRRIPYDFFGELPAFHARFGANLRPADRAVVEALMEPDVARRLDRLEALVAAAPGDPYLRFLYAEELFHRGPLVGRGSDLAVRAMAATIALDSTFAEAYNHIFTVRLRTGRRAEAERFLELRRRVSLEPWPGDPDVVALMSLAYDERFRPWLGWLKLRVAELGADSARLSDLSRVARLGAPWFDLPGTQVAIGRILLRRGPRADSAQASARTGVALGLLTLGRPTEALVQLDSAVEQFPSPEARLQQAEWRAIPPVVGLPRLNVPDIDSDWRQQLEALSVDTLLGPRALWALALGHLGAGDTAAFGATAERLAALKPASPLVILLRSIGRGVHGEADAALTISDSVRALFEVNDPPDPFAGAVFHLLRGEWRRARGDPLGAGREWLWYEGSDFRGWPAGLPQAAEIEATFGVYARWRRGALLQSTATSAGDSAAACALLQRAAELWAGSEPTMRPLRIAATARAGACAP